MINSKFYHLDATATDFLIFFCFFADLDCLDGVAVLFYPLISP